MDFLLRKRGSLLIILIGITLLFHTSKSLGYDSSIFLDADTQHLTVQSKITYLVEERPLSHIEASGPAYSSQWQTAPSKTINLGSFHNPVWFRFDVVNKADTDLSWLMEIGWPLLDRIEVYQYNHVKDIWYPEQVAGNILPMADRAVKHRKFLFPLNFPPGELTTVYVRVETRGSLLLTIDIWQHAAFYQSNQHNIILLGSFFGILIVMLLYNISLYYFTRDKNYFYYSFYVFSIILYTLAHTGIGTQYVWDTSVWVKHYGYLTFSSLGFMAATLFMREFLSLKQYKGWVIQLNNVFLAYWIFATFFSAFWQNKVLLKTTEPMALLTCIAGFVICFYLLAKGSRAVKYYLIAWSFLIFGTFIRSLSIYGIIDRTPFTQNTQMVGFVVEVILISFALAERINREKAEREKAQEAALELSQKINKERTDKLEAQEQVLALQRRTNQELELRVLDRTAELERAMHNLEIANKELSKLNITDPLTKIYNRRYFDEILSQEIKRANRMQHPLSVALIDIDHFKNINDTHGHLIGDECLRLIAKTLKQEIKRTGDFVARYGGEEFVIVLLATSQKNAVSVADRVRTAIENLSIIQRGKKIKICVSIGVAGWVPENDESPEKLITAADDALYDAKNSGRNQVAVAH